MNLRQKLAVSFFIIVLFPAFLVGILIFAANRGYGIFTDNYLKNVVRFSNSVEDIAAYSRGAYEALLEDVAAAPDSFRNRNFLTDYNEGLSSVFSFIAVRDSHRLIFDGSGENIALNLYELPDFNNEIVSQGILLVPRENSDILVRGTPLTFSDGGTGEVLFITEAKALLPESRRSIVDLSVSVALILIITAAILVLWIYGGIISKVNILLSGANKIKDGDFDFTLTVQGDDELSELINTFESMKEQLRKDSEEKLAFENEQRELITNIAHDLKTPLTAIRGYAEGILDGVADTKEKQEVYLRTIGKKADELNLLLNELTTYSNITTNRIPYNFNHISVKNYFEDFYEETKLDLEAKQAECSMEFMVSPGVEMIADPEQLKRVIENIVENSVKYKSERKLSVHFTVKELEGYIQVEIKDNGKGIATEELPYIFDRMYRADASRKSSVAGSGLGLSIAKKIVEDHGGRIWATSHLGEGTTFYFIIRMYTLHKTENTK